MVGTGMVSVRTFLFILYLILLLSYLIVILSYCYLILLLSYLIVILSYCYLILLLSYLIVILSYCYLILSYYLATSGIEPRTCRHMARSGPCYDLGGSRPT